MSPQVSNSSERRFQNQLVMHRFCCVLLLVGEERYIEVAYIHAFMYMPNPLDIHLIHAKYQKGKSQEKSKNNKKNSKFLFQPPAPDPSNSPLKAR
jgi:hypothetical protein